MTIWSLFKRSGWINYAACRGDLTDSWFIPPNVLSQTERQRLIDLCRICPVKRECFEEALQDRKPSGYTRAGQWWSWDKDSKRKIVKPLAHPSGSSR